jgi:BCD family chlorophyll transporter-like MFS transporter
MMNLVSAGHRNREGTRMGIWGASQAVAYGTGGFLGTFASDATQHLVSSVSRSYALVFAAEAGLYLFAASLAIWAVRPMVKAVPTSWPAKQEV